ncbi:hypothetical protein U1Q18_021399 [Sarracenia purpurea var. burkii]
MLHVVYTWFNYGSPLSMVFLLCWKGCFARVTSLYRCLQIEVLHQVSSFCCSSLGWLLVGPWGFFWGFLGLWGFLASGFLLRGVDRGLSPGEQLTMLYLFAVVGRHLCFSPTWCCPSWSRRLSYTTVELKADVKKDGSGYITSEKRQHWTVDYT